MFPYDIGCFDCDANQQQLLKRTNVWDGYQPVILVADTADKQVLYLDVLLSTCCPIMSGTVFLAAYDVNTAVVTNPTSHSYTVANGKLTGSATWSSLFTSEQAVYITFVDTCGNAHKQDPIALIVQNDPCNEQEANVPTLLNSFKVDVCSVDICSLACDTNAVKVDGSVIGYFDNKGKFITTSTTYKNTQAINGFIIDNVVYLSVIPGIDPALDIQLIMNGDTYSLNGCGPNPCGYYE